MANKRRDVYKAKPMTEGKKAVIQGLLNEYDIQSAEDIQDALKDLLSGTIQTMLLGQLPREVREDLFCYGGTDDMVLNKITKNMCLNVQ